jgi:hypothetical protein
MNFARLSVLEAFLVVSISVTLALFQHPIPWSLPLVLVLWPLLNATAVPLVLIQNHGATVHHKGQLRTQQSSAASARLIPLPRRSSPRPEEQSSDRRKHAA